MKLILDTSEDLFAQLGYFGVTIKDVGDKMGIHPALIHYYFDGKKALFDAVFERRVEYAITTRTAGLDAYEAEVGDHPTVEGALRAYYDGAFDVYINGDEGWRNFGRIFAQVNNAPGYGAEKMDTYFDPLVLRLIGLLQKALPDATARGSLLELPVHLGRLFADPVTDRPHRSSVGQVVCVRRFRGGSRAVRHLHGGRLRGPLQAREAEVGLSLPAVALLQDETTGPAVRSRASRSAARRTLPASSRKGSLVNSILLGSLKRVSRPATNSSSSDIVQRSAFDRLDDRMDARAPVLVRKPDHCAGPNCRMRIDRSFDLSRIDVRTA